MGQIWLIMTRNRKPQTSLLDVKIELEQHLTIGYSFKFVSRTLFLIWTKRKKIFLAVPLLYCRKKRLANLRILWLWLDSPGNPQGLWPLQKILKMLVEISFGLLLRIFMALPSSWQGLCVHLTLRQYKTRISFPCAPSQRGCYER